MVILSGLILAEAWQVPLGYANVWQKTPKVYQWLAKQQDDVVSYEIPSFDQKTDVARDARYLFWSIKHRKRMINGYSGYFLSTTVSFPSWLLSLILTQWCRYWSSWAQPI
jgi:hypothetical protein